MTEASDFVLVSTTVDSKAAADGLARAIVEEKLAACVQCTAIKSTYRWKGEIETADEWLLLAKTRASLGEKLIAFIKESHSYEVPEAVVTPIAGGYPDYLAWIREETA